MNLICLAASMQSLVSDLSSDLSVNFGDAFLNLILVTFPSFVKIARKTMTTSTSTLGVSLDRSGSGFDVMTGGTFPSIMPALALAGIEMLNVSRNRKLRRLLLGMMCFLTRKRWVYSSTCTA